MAVEHAAEDTVVSQAPVQRLCNEIQLFDLCDLDKCSFKADRFCTDPDLLTAFERIAEPVVARPEMCDSEELEEGDEGFDEDFEDDGYGDEAEYDDEG